jgi:hypothetical protein
VTIETCEATGVRGPKERSVFMRSRRATPGPSPPQRR